LGARWPVQRLPSGDLLTPLLTATAAVHRSVFNRVRFDPNYRGNAFREETDFFFTCLERGIQTLYCPHVACGHMKSHAGSAPGGSWSMSRPRYALQMLINNWRFLRRHDALLRRVRGAAGLRTGSIRMQARFLLTVLGRMRSRS